MITYLVTGCLGFIGSTLAEHLIRSGHRVIGLDNESTGQLSHVELIRNHPNFTLLLGDIRDIETCRQACRSVNFVLHQAALGSVPKSIETPTLYHDVNVTGTLNLLTACREMGVQRFIYASSSSVYGDTPTLPKIETMALQPKSPYAATKLICELYAKMYYECYGLETIGLRYFNVFGPRQNPNSQYAAVIPKFITACLSGESPVIFGDGEQTRDFTFIGNVVQANLLACAAPTVALGHAINIGSGNRLSLNTLASLIQSETKCTSPLSYQAPRAGDVRDSMADVGRLRDWLGLTQTVTLEDGLAETINWYRGQL